MQSVVGTKTYDVVVLGGGLAGVAAAVACSRRSMKVALVEKTVMFGGLATAGLVPVYMCLCDGSGRQVTFGLAEDLLRLSVKYGPGRIPEPWAPPADDGSPPPWSERYSCHALYPEANLDQRYMAIFSPPSLALSLDELLEQSGVELWLDSLACTPVVENRNVTGVEIENKSGRIRLEAACFVDATGDANIAFRAGAPCIDQGSYPTYLYQEVSSRGLDPAVEERGRQGGGASESAAATGRLLSWAGIGGKELEDGNRAAGRLHKVSSGRDISELVMASRRIARDRLADQQSGDGPFGRELRYPAVLPTLPQVRRGRRIDGVETIEAEAAGRRIQSSIGMMADCRAVDRVWELPYGCLLPRGVGNLLVAGRCCSARDYAWHVSRLIPAVALTGEAAGIAAAMSVEKKSSPGDLDCTELQGNLETSGITVHL